MEVSDQKRRGGQNCFRFVRLPSICTTARRWQEHIDAKYLWLQDKVKAGDLEMEGVATVLNVADINTKKLAKARRSFLMYLIGLVEYDEASKG